MSHCIHCRVTGKVQGVWFRGTTRDQAQGLGLTGHARNLPDGSVEVVACGGGESLERLKTWLWQGPPAAQVDVVECEDIELQPTTGFFTR
jgi:acylphosphatase